MSGEAREAIGEEPLRLYVMGVQGQVARSLREMAAALSDVAIGCAPASVVDVREPEAIEAATRAFRPHVIVNPAAYTAVDRAEDEAELAFAINRDGARNVAWMARVQNVPVIHLSTDYVFDGSKASPYLETDTANPQGVYGRSKYEGELAVRDENPRAVILRTSWVYAPFGSNSVRSMLRLAGQRERIGVVNDQIGCPTSARDIARVIIAIARQITDWQAEYAGVTHMVGSEAMSWYAFAERIFAASAARGGRPIPGCRPSGLKPYSLSNCRRRQRQSPTVWAGSWRAGEIARGARARESSMWRPIEARGFQASICEAMNPGKRPPEVLKLRRS